MATRTSQTAQAVGYHAGAISVGSKLTMCAKSTVVWDTQATASIVSARTGSNVVTIPASRRNPIENATSKPVPVEALQRAVQGWSNHRYCSSELACIVRLFLDDFGQCIDSDPIVVISRDF